MCRFTLFPSRLRRVPASMRHVPDHLGTSRRKWIAVHFRLVRAPCRRARDRKICRDVRLPPSPMLGNGDLPLPYNHIAQQTLEHGFRRPQRQRHTTPKCINLQFPANIVADFKGRPTARFMTRALKPQK